MFTPMALTVLMALLRRADLLGDLRAGRGRDLRHRQGLREGEPASCGGAKRVYLPLLDGAIRSPGVAWSLVAVAIVVASALPATRMGGEFIPSLDEGDIALAALRIPGTSLTQSVDMQQALEKRIRQIPEVEGVLRPHRHRRDRDRSDAAHMTDGYIMLEAARRSGPTRRRPKSDLVEEIEQAADEIPGSNYEFSQPIQLRVNELISGVRSDVGVKIFGDDLDILQGAAKQVQAAIRGIRGATDVKTEQVAGLPILTVDIDRAGARRATGSASAEVQTIVEIAIGGKTAGKLFEGDRRFDIVVRLPENLRGDLEAIRPIPIPLPPAEGSAGLTRRRWRPGRADALRPALVGGHRRCGAGPEPDQPRKRQAPRSSSPPTCAGATSARSWPRRSAAVAEKVKLPPGYWIGWGGQFEQLVSARQRLTIVVPRGAAAGLLLLFMSFGSVARRAAGLQRRAAGADRRRRSRCCCAAFRCRSPPASASSRCPASRCSTASS